MTSTQRLNHMAYGFLSVNVVNVILLRERNIAPSSGKQPLLFLETYPLLDGYNECHVVVYNVCP